MIDHLVPQLFEMFVVKLRWAQGAVVGFGLGDIGSLCSIAILNALCVSRRACVTTRAAGRVSATWHTCSLDLEGFRRELVPDRACNLEGPIAHARSAALLQVLLCCRW
jgi:hypothetical protein